MHIDKLGYKRPVRKGKLRALNIVHLIDKVQEMNLRYLASQLVLYT